MKAFTKEELKTILDNHKHWLKEDCEGWEDMRADLSGADLMNANLMYANLRHADLIHANLSHANLSGADLIGTNLIHTNLSHANLSGAIFMNANLIHTNLRHANLSGANLNYADLSGADLIGANLVCANLMHAKNIPFIPYSCPDFGMFIGYKKANGKIIELEIPTDARRCSATGRKCRCDKAKVLGIYDYNHNLLPDKEVNSDRGNLTYKVGEIVYPDSYDDNRLNECSHGIHFFINFQEAVNY